MHIKDLQLCSAQLYDFRIKWEGGGGGGGVWAKQILFWTLSNMYYGASKNNKRLKAVNCLNKKVPS